MARGVAAHPGKDRAGHLRDRCPVLIGDVLKKPVNRSDTELAHPPLTQAGDDLGDDPVAVARSGSGGLLIQGRDPGFGQRLDSCVGRDLGAPVEMGAVPDGFFQGSCGGALA